MTKNNITLISMRQSGSYRLLHPFITTSCSGMSLGLLSKTDDIPTSFSGKVVVILSLGVWHVNFTISSLPQY